MQITLTIAHARRLAVATVLSAGLVATMSGAQTTGRLDANDSLARAVLKELIEINTGPRGGLMTKAAQAVARRLTAAGYHTRDVVLAGPNAKYQNVVAHLRGRDSTLKPILLMAHLDVVEVLASDWSMDPFTLHEKDGYFYGRGSTDNKGGAAVLVANMVRWKRETFIPSRDVIMVLTTDEETTAENGIQWLLKNLPELTKVEYALNIDAGGLLERPGQPTAFYFQASEKMYQTYALEVTNRGGHSSLPRDDNAIYGLARGLERLARFQFPVMYNEITRVSFARSGELERGDLAEDLKAAARGATDGEAIARLSKMPQYNGNLRTTCVATMLAAGHAENALPQKATATVNCRIFPGVSAAQIQGVLQRVVDDTSIHVTTTAISTPSDASPLRPDVFGTVESLARAMWPGATSIPIMENGATDGLFLRNLGVPVYGVAGPLYDVSDDRAHGRDERVSVRHFYQVREFWYRLVKSLASGAPVS